MAADGKAKYWVKKATSVFGFCLYYALDWWSALILQLLASLGYDSSSKTHILLGLKQHATAAATGPLERQNYAKILGEVDNFWFGFFLYYTLEKVVCPGPRLPLFGLGFLRLGAEARVEHLVACK